MVLRRIALAVLLFGLFSGGLMWLMKRAFTRSPGDLNFPRACHTATLLGNGNVLVVGGFCKDSLLRQALNHSLRPGRMWYPITNYLTCEEYNPTTHAWSLTASVANPRVGATATLLPDGQVLLAGGADPSLSPIPCELFDPVASKWRSTGGRTFRRAFGEAVVMADGEVLLAGGEVDVLPTSTDFTLHMHNSPPVPIAERFNPLTKTWKTISQFNFPYHAHCIALDSGKVLIAGGIDLKKKAILTKCYLYDPFKDTFTTTASLPDRDYFLTALKLADGRVLLTSGKNCYLYDPVAETWSVTGGLKKPTNNSFTTTLLHSGRVLYIGGNPSTGDCEVYDPRTGTWSETGKMKTPRFAGTAICLRDGRVLVVGGETSFQILGTCEIYDPATGIWEYP